LVPRDHDATTVVFFAVAVCDPDAEFSALGGGEVDAVDDLS